MKKFIFMMIFTIFISVLPVSANHYGVKVGVSISKMNLTNEMVAHLDAKNLTKFSVCGFFNIKLSESLSLQPEICHVKKKGLNTAILIKAKSLK